MTCPDCKGKMTCIETREKKAGIYRRYKCATCNTRPLPSIERLYAPIKKEPK